MLDGWSIESSSNSQTLKWMFEMHAFGIIASITSLESARSLLPRIPEAKGTSRLKLPDYFAVCDSYPSSCITQFSASIVSLSPAINTDALLPLPSPRAQTHINTYTHENICWGGRWEINDVAGRKFLVPRTHVWMISVNIATEDRQGEYESRCIWYYSES